MSESLPQIEYEEPNAAIKLLEQALRECNEEIEEKRKGIERAEIARQNLDMRLERLLQRRKAYAGALVAVGGENEKP